MRILLAALIAVAITLGSCSEEKRISKKVNKIGAEKVLAWLKENRKDLFIVKRDTVRDTVIIQTLRVDTTVKWSEMTIHDTVVIQKDRLKVKIVRVNDTLRVSGECLGDTVYVKVPCPEYVVPAPVPPIFPGGMHKLIIPFLLLIALYIMWRYFTQTSQ